jgi:hypothetical protein
MMKTTTFRPLALAIVVLAFAALVFVAFSFSARLAEAQEEGAVVLNDFFCSATFPPAPPLSTNQSHAVITPSGNMMFVCHFEGPPIAETINVKDFVCNTPLGGTTESHFVYTRSGQATATCHINPGG